MQPLDTVLPDENLDVNVCFLVACLGKGDSAALAWFVIQLVQPNAKNLAAIENLHILTVPGEDGAPDLPTFKVNKQELRKDAADLESPQLLFGHYLTQFVLTVIRYLFLTEPLHHQSVKILPVESAEGSELTYIAVCLSHVDATDIPPHTIAHLEVTPMSILDFEKQCNIPEAQGILVNHLLCCMRDSSLFERAVRIFDKQIPALADLIYDREPWMPEFEQFYYEFLIPLLQLCYQVLLHIRTHIVGNEDLSAMVDLKTAHIEVLLKGLIDRSMLSSPTSPLIHESTYRIHFSEETWTQESVVQTLLWIDQVLSPSNWKGDPFFYIHLPHPQPLVPKLTAFVDGNVHVLTEFGSSLIFPHTPTPEETRQIWNDLAAWYDEQEKDTSEEASVAWNYKRAVFEALLNKIPFKEDHHHLDLCCGPGNMKRALPPTVDMYGLDIAENMVTRAQERGVKAYQVDLNRDRIPFPDNSIDSATISFGEMWLDHDTVFPEVYRILKPGGTLVFNVYSPKRDWEIEYISKLKKAGFTHATSEAIKQEVQTSEQSLISQSHSEVFVYIVSGTK